MEKISEGLWCKNCAFFEECTSEEIESNDGLFNTQGCESCGCAFDDHRYVHVVPG